MKPLVIYHGNCADGFTAAWLANIYFNSKSDPGSVSPDDWVVDHHAGVYGEPPPAVDGRHVFVLDFSYPRDVMCDMIDRAESVTIIDHHVTAIQELAPLFHVYPEDKLRLVLSDRRSGAYLTSKFFWPDREPMEMVRLVDDRDRWVFADERTRPFHASLFSFEYTPSNWNRVYRTPIEELVAEGEAIDRKHMKDIKELLDVMTLWVEIAGLRVPAANLSYISASDACHELLQRHPEAPFAASWFKRKDGKAVVSLRSRTGSDVDVGQIAKALGGGGHKHSSGFACDLQTLGV
ncbi:MAG: DHHA1 domain-containing protein [Trueperaceae bacterium]